MEDYSRHCDCKFNLLYHRQKLELTLVTFFAAHTRGKGCSRFTKDNTFQLCTFQQSIQKAATTTTTTEELNQRASTESGDGQCFFFSKVSCFLVQIFAMRGEEINPSNFGARWIRTLHGFCILSALFDANSSNHKAKPEDPEHHVTGWTWKHQDLDRLRPKNLPGAWLQ